MVKNTLTFNVSAHGREVGKCDYNKLRNKLMESGFNVDGKRFKNGETYMLVEGIEYDEFLDYADDADIDEIEDYVEVPENDYEEVVDLDVAFDDYVNDDFIEEDEDVVCDENECVAECDELDEDMFMDFDDDAMFDDDIENVEDEFEYPAADEFIEDDMDNMIDDDYYACLDDEDCMYESRKTLRRKSINESRENVETLSRYYRDFIKWLEETDIQEVKKLVRHLMRQNKDNDEILELITEELLTQFLTELNILDDNEVAMFAAQMSDTYGEDLRWVNAVSDVFGDELFVNESRKTLRRKPMNESRRNIRARLNRRKALKESRKTLRRKSINERYAINKRKGCCGGGTTKNSGKLYSLSEALKAFDEKQQKKLDKSINSIEDIVKDIKGQSIGQAEVTAAFKKLKSEQNALKKIAKNEKGDKFKVTDVKGVNAIIKKMIEADPEHAEEIKKFKSSLTESIVVALNGKKKSLYENVKIDGKSISSFKSKKLYRILKESKALKTKYVKALKNETIGSELSEKLKKAIDIKNKLIDILNEELSYRYMCRTIAKPLFEDEEKDSEKDTEKDDNTSDDGGISDEELAKMFGTSDTDDTEDDEKDSEKDEDSISDEDEEVEIARVVIEMASKEDAEDMKQHCIDAGIPEDAIEIEEGDESESDEENSDEEAEGDDTEGGDASDESEGGDANESIRYSELRRLFEDEETEGDESEDGETTDNAEGNESDEESESDNEAEEGGVKFVLTNTDYIDELAEVLNDVYGISNEEFEDMIGGEIVKDDENSSDDEDEADSDSDSDNSDSDTDDEISASDIFGNM